MTQIHAEKQQTKGKKGWKFFFWVYLILIIVFVVSGLLMSIFDPASFYETFENPVQDFLTVPISLVSLIGIYGFAYDKAIWSPKIWLAVLGFVGLGFLYDFSSNIQSFQGAELVFFLILMVVVTGAEILALYKYIYASDTIWNQHKTAS